MSSADFYNLHPRYFNSCLILSRLLWGKFSTFSAANAIRNFPIFCSTRYHYYWVGEAVWNEKFAWHFWLMTSSGNRTPDLLILSPNALSTWPHALNRGHCNCHWTFNWLMFCVTIDSEQHLMGLLGCSHYKSVHIVTEHLRYFHCCFTRASRVLHLCLVLEFMLKTYYKMWTE